MQEDLSYLGGLFNPLPFLDWAGDKISGACEFAKKAKKSGKEKASDVPSWAAGKQPLPGESGNDYADRLLKDKYGDDSYPKGLGTEHNKLKKYGDRSRN